MSIFEPAIVKKLLGKHPKVNGGDEEKFLEEWTEQAKNYVEGWKTGLSDLEQTNQQAAEQLQWLADIMIYVDHIHKLTRVHGNSKSQTATLLPIDIPLLGPKFLPPPPSQFSKRSQSKTINPEAFYLKPVIILHPLFLADLSSNFACPGCRRHGTEPSVYWQQWNPTGPRTVHGISRKEMVIGYQMKCNTCQKHAREEKANGSTPRQQKWSTTNTDFWDGIKYFEVPAYIPHFMWRSAVTRELYDMIIEFRISSTSGTMAQHIKQMHLFEYHRSRLEYYRLISLTKSAGKQQQQQLNFTKPPQQFSNPFDPHGYNDSSIAAEQISEVYLHFSRSSRKDESDRLLRSLAAIAISLDHTFKVMKKAGIVQSNLERSNPFSGGQLTILNDENLVIAWRMCQSGSHVETTELINGIKRRCEEMGIELPQICVADNCCTVEKSIRDALPDIEIGLDIYHFRERYMAVIEGGKRSANKTAIQKDIVSALLEKTADATSPAIYRTKEEQEIRLQKAYEKWSKQNAWSAAAFKVHQTQMLHVKKGCLTRSRNDIRTDGSRIEGFHKALNDLQRTYASGLVVYMALVTDFILRRNVRIASASNSSSSPFITSTFGSHNLMLVDLCANLWNNLKKNTQSALSLFANVQSGETFGIVASQHILEGTFIKFEDLDNNTTFDQLLESQELDEIAATLRELMDELNINPSEFELPASTGETLSPSPSTSKRSMEDNLGEGSSSGRATKQPRTLAMNTPQGSLAKPIGQALHPFFQPRRTDAPAPIQAIPPAQSTLSPSPQQQHAPAAEPPQLDTLHLSLPANLTRTQLLFQVQTQVDPRSLKIEGNEWYDFMKLRKINLWQMATVNLRDMTDKFNLRVAENPSTGPKDPRALRSALEQVEKNIRERIKNNNYASKSGDEKFWKEHCGAFTLLVNEKGKKVRKDQACERCQKIKYPFASGDPRNHKRDYCDDGVGSSLRELTYPQHEGIFSNGRTVDCHVLLRKIRNILQTAQKHIGESHHSMSPQDCNLSKLIEDRIVRTESHRALLDLTGLEISPSQKCLIVEEGGKSCIELKDLDDI